MRTYNKTKSHQNIPRRNNAAEKNWNPINGSSISTSDTGIVSLSKGNVFYDLNDNEGARGTEFFSEVVVRDEYGNLVKMLRSSDIEDTSALGSYINNQTIHNSPNERLGYIDGRPSNAEKDANTKFTFSVDTNTTYEGSTTSTQFQLPLISSGTISMNVDWGDGTSDVITTYNQAETLHTYAASGVYTIKITNEVRGWQFINGGDKLKMNDISNWGQLNITEHSSFHGCSNMTATATDSPIISSTNLKNTFYSCTSFNGQIGNWDVRKVTQMHYMFYYCSVFNQPLNNWNTSSLTNAISMFRGCSNFNQNIDNWNVSSVTNMYGMFNDCFVFNQPLDSWDVTSCSSFVQMLMGCTLFNQPLNSWDISSTNNISMMFWNASNFNQPLNNWDTSSVVSMSYLFRYASNFNQDLGSWDIRSVTSMTDIMRGVTLGTSNYDSLLTGWLGSPTLGSELVTNGDFDGNTTGWTEVNINTTFSPLLFTNTANNGSIRQNFTTIVGRRYKLSGDILSGAWAVYASTSTSTGGSLGSITVTGDLIFTATTTTTYVLCYLVGGSGTEGVIDNVSVKEVFNAPPLDLVPNFGGSEYKLYGDAETARNELVNNYGWTITDGGGVLPTDESFEFSVDTNSQTLGTEMVNNGDFSDRTTGWSDSNTAASATQTLVAGGLEMYSGTVADNSNRMSRTTPSYMNGQIGKTYILTITATDFVGANQGYIRLDGVYDSSNIISFSASTTSVTFVAYRDFTLIQFFAGSSNKYYTINDVSLKEVLSDTDQFQLPLISSGDINMVVHWGDTTTSNITSYNESITLHTYPSPGTYTINIYREVKGWKFAQGGDRLKMGVISNWGGFNVTNSSSFYGCSYMTCTATTAPIVSTTDLLQTFRNCHLFDGAIGNWDVRNVTDLYGLLYGCNSFNQPLNNWDTSSATRTRYMFYNCNEFNQPINNWEMKYVGDMGRMFLSATNFDQNISQWDITSATDMTRFMEGVTLSTTNYDELLMQWEDSGSVQEPELVSNGDFSEEGVELLGNADFAIYEPSAQSNLVGGVQFDDWSENPSTGKRTLSTISNGFRNEVVEQQTSTWQQRVYQSVSSDLVIGKTYRFKATFSTSDGSSIVVAIQTLGSQNRQAGATYTTEVGVPQSIDIYFVCDNNTYQYVDLWATTLQEIGESYTASEISIKEVGQDWTLSANASVENSELIFNANSINVYTIQPLFAAGLYDGKTLKISYQVTENTLVGNGALRLGGYTGSSIMPIMTNINSDVGVHSINIIVDTSGNNNAIDLWITSAYSSGSIKINNISIKEVLNSPPIGITTNFGGSRYTAEAIPARESLVNSYGWTIVDGGESV